MVYLDLANVCVIVNHHLLRQFVSWIKPFMKGLTYSAKVRTNLSSPATAVSSIPQGPVIGLR